MDYQKELICQTENYKLRVQNKTDHSPDFYYLSNDWKSAKSIDSSSDDLYFVIKHILLWIYQSKRDLIKNSDYWQERSDKIKEYIKEREEFINKIMQREILSSKK